MVFYLHFWQLKYSSVLNNFWKLNNSNYVLILAVELSAWSACHLLCNLYVPFDSVGLLISRSTFWLNKATFSFSPKKRRKQNCIIVKNKHHHNIMLLKSFRLNGYTVGFYTQNFLLWEWQIRVKFEVIFPQRSDLHCNWVSLPKHPQQAFLQCTREVNPRHCLSSHNY